MLGLDYTLWHPFACAARRPLLKNVLFSRGARGHREFGSMNTANQARAALFKQAEVVAKALLRDSGIVEPPVPIIELAEGAGLEVIFAKFPAENANVSGFIELESKKVFVNLADSRTRQAFTIAHELGHWCLHRTKIHQDPKLYRVLKREPVGGQKSDLEQQANWFAAQLLVPPDFLQRYIAGNVYMPSEQSLAEIFAVSKDVIHYRLKDEQRSHRRRR